MSDIRRIQTKDVAKLIRKDLKRNFPSVKFSVRSDVYAGGSSIDVFWTDGPTAKQVESVAKAYVGSGFDGMTDYKYGFHSYLNGERVKFLVDFIFCNREHSEEFRQKSYKSFCEKYGEPEDKFGGDIEFSRFLRGNTDSEFAFVKTESFAIPDLEEAQENRLSVYPKEERAFFNNS